MALAERIVERWYGGKPRPLLLRPLTWLYRGATALRAWLYRHGWLASVRLPVPVLVVGNLTVGGTGKTPLVIALAEHLRERGWHPGVVSRGYAGGAERPQLLTATPDPARHGDEPCLIRQRTGVPVAVGHDRPAAARLLLDAGCDVVIADDGLQHYRLQRDVEICVIDAARRFGNGLMLPCGPLREAPARLRRVDFRVCNGEPAGAGEVPMRLAGNRAQHLRVATRRVPLQDFAGGTVHAVAGIGNPQRFFDSLRARGIQVREHAFPDHHAFTRADLDFGDDLPVLMTEKDAVKCAAFAHDQCWSVPVHAVLPETFLDAVAQRLNDIPTKNPM